MSELRDLERDLLRSARVLDVPSNAGRERARGILSVGAGAAAGAAALLASTHAKPAAVGKLASWPLWKLVCVAGAVAVAGGGATLALGHRPITSGSPVMAVGSPVAPPAAVVETAPAAPAVAEDPAAPPAGEKPVVETKPSVESARAEPSPARVAASFASASAPSTSVTDEMMLLDRIRTSVESRRTSDALALLADFDRRFPSARMRQEATVYRIETLYQAGQTRDAAALARRFLAANPTSSHADHVRNLAREYGGGGSAE
jgi:hypothetical protein